MIIIEGRQGKSKVLEVMINTQLNNINVVILDTVEVKGLIVPKGVDHYILDEADSQQAIQTFEDYYQNNFAKYDWIVFLVNQPHHEIVDFKFLDLRYPQNFILTVQNDEIIEPKTYYL